VPATIRRSVLPENRVKNVSGTLRKSAERIIIGCEGCAPDDAELPFDNVHDRVTGNDPAATDYIMVECVAKCPQCKRPTNEKTLVECSE
jgi:hypothetical protein